MNRAIILLWDSRPRLSDLGTAEGGCPTFTRIAPPNSAPCFLAVFRRTTRARFAFRQAQVRLSVLTSSSRLRGENRISQESLTYGVRPKVSLTVIARDEEKNLPACLESVRGISDEIVVVDTGSKDRTV